MVGGNIQMSKLKKSLAVLSLMAVGAATGFEMNKIGGGRIAGALLPAIWFALLATIWMLFAGLVAKALAGA